MIPSLIRRYIRWLHTRWPAGVVEKLPEVRADFSTNVPGLYVVGDLAGVPLLKFAAESGAAAVRTIAADPTFQRAGDEKRCKGVKDLVILGGGVSGMAAALEAQRLGLEFEILEASEPFATIVNFPRAKPIFTYPKEMEPRSPLRVTASVKEELVEELRRQTVARGIEPTRAKIEYVRRRDGYLECVAEDGATYAAKRVIVAIGRSGNYRRLGVPGEERDKVYYRLHDPRDFRQMNVLVVGGGDSALETSIALVVSGARVTLCHRGERLTRPKQENVDKLYALLEDAGAEVDVERPESERVTTSAGSFSASPEGHGSLRLLLGCTVEEISESSVTLKRADGEREKIGNDVVFVMAGRDAPLDFFRRSGVRIKGEMTSRQWGALSLFLLFCAFVYNWKGGGSLTRLFGRHGWFPFNMGHLLEGAAESSSPTAAALSVTLSDPGFYYSLAYTLLVLIFGLLRIRRRRTPYVTVQTLSLIFFQIVPLFLLPYVVLPLLGHAGFFDHGIAKAVADQLFPAVDYGHGREYWRAFGFILAWPLFIWNVFSSEPLWGWLAISLIQTFVVIPLIIYYWGKGAYCGFICSCGAMAETLGDTFRHKMPHGPRWNRLNAAGQVILAVAAVMLAVRIVGWAVPDTVAGRAAASLFEGMLYKWEVLGVQTNYKWTVDVLLAGIVGYGLYFWYSGRVWCRFFCPLAALMHVYARFSRFRILADKKRCISCNVCTSVCHQGIDVMNFANKGLPMEDPECVRCSACVEACPTGVLRFGQIDRRSGRPIKVDGIDASPVLMREREGSS